MEIALKLKFKSFEELQSWFDSTCTKCCLCNDARNCCQTCRVNKIWMMGCKDFKKEDELEKDEE